MSNIQGKAMIGSRIRHTKPGSPIRELTGAPRNRREARAAAAIAKKAARTKTKV